MCFTPVIFSQYQTEETIYDFAEPEPSFPGGQAALIEFLTKNTVYPAEAKEMELEGKCYVQFVVEKDGTCTNFILVKGSHDILDKEALRVVKSMPKWEPGMVQGQPVRVKMIIPIIFRLT
jgi:protein TonB